MKNKSTYTYSLGIHTPLFYSFIMLYVYHAAFLRVKSHIGLRANFPISRFM